MKRTRPVIAVLVLWGVTALGASGQMLPDCSHVLLYFPQLTEGGTEAAGWQTIFTFTNYSLTDDVWAFVILEFYGDDGQPWALDLGSGPTTQMSFWVPPQGIRVLKSRMQPGDTRTGWAVARASYPVQGSVAFRQFIGRQMTAHITAHGTSPTALYVSAANPQLGVALANIHFSAVPFTLTLRDMNGSVVGRQLLTFPARTHRAFNLVQYFPWLPASFLGTVSISSADTAYPHFIAWTLHSDMENGFLSSLPDGGSRWPPKHRDRIWRVWLKLQPVAEDLAEFLGANLDNLELDISYEQQVQAYAIGGSKVRINAATSQLLGDSESELAFVIGHELAHIIQFRTGQQLFSQNAELDADAVGTMLVLLAGYDPYAAAGVFGRLHMASKVPGLLGEILRDLIAPHRSFATRIDNVLTILTTVCAATPELVEACADYKSIFHPQLPDTLPLAQPPEAVLLAPIADEAVPGGSAN